MAGLFDLFLNGMTIYGPLALGLALLLGAGGLPIPIGLLMLAAGAFARQGLLDWHVAIVVGLMAVILGDVVSYSLGRFAGGRLEGYIRERRAALWQRAQTQFRQHGALAVWLTRFLLTSLDVPTNLIAGGSGYEFRRFLAYGIAGRAAWLALYGGLGYAFGSQWRLVSQAIGSYGGWLGLGAVVGGGLYLFLRHLREKRDRSDNSTGDYCEDCHSVLKWATICAAPQHSLEDEQGDRTLGSRKKGMAGLDPGRHAVAGRSLRPDPARPHPRRGGRRFHCRPLPPQSA
jgi:membrane protein DedA with SNARE-associated domain